MSWKPSDRIEALMFRPLTYEEEQEFREYARTANMNQKTNLDLSATGVTPEMRRLYLVRMIGTKVATSALGHRLGVWRGVFYSVTSTHQAPYPSFMYATCSLCGHSVFLPVIKKLTTDEQPFLFKFGDPMQLRCKPKRRLASGVRRRRGVHDIVNFKRKFS